MNNFNKITAIYKQEYPDAISSTVTGGTSPQKGAVANKAAKVAAAARRFQVMFNNISTPKLLNIVLINVRLVG